MEKWLLVVETKCKDPAKEKEFNQWYDSTHIPDVLSIPGVLSATRYQNPNPGEKQGKFTANYEIETKDISQTMLAFKEGMGKWGKAGRLSKDLEIASACFYRQIAAPVKKK
jgi:hypothetical protein